MQSNRAQGAAPEIVILANVIVWSLTHSRNSVTRFFASGFFHESVSPQPQIIPLGPFRIFSKKFETALMVYSGAWGKLIHEKNQKSKIS
jgi:hypothetical protein